MSILRNTQLWLILIAIAHTALGVGGAYSMYGNDQLAIIGFFSLISIYLVY